MKYVIIPLLRVLIAIIMVPGIYILSFLEGFWDLTWKEFKDFHKDVSRGAIQYYIITGKDKPQPEVAENLCSSGEDDINKLYQEHEDYKIQSAAGREALDMWRQYMAGYVMLIPKPQIGFIKNYYPYTSKWTSESYHTFVHEEFNKLKEQNPRPDYNLYYNRL